MSGFCSAHRHHEPSCGVCCATPPAELIAELTAENAELRARVSELEDAIDWDEADGHVATSYGRDTYSVDVQREVAARRPGWNENGHGAVTARQRKP
jgi:hypothetical protein